MNWGRLILGYILIIFMAAIFSYMYLLLAIHVLWVQSLFVIAWFCISVFTWNKLEP